MVGLAQGGDDLALDIRAALRALGAIGVVIALRAEEVTLPSRKYLLIMSISRKNGQFSIKLPSNSRKASLLLNKCNSPGEKATLREGGLAPVATEARRVEVDVVGDSEDL